MAKKSMFFSVVIRDGYGPKTMNPVAAKSGEHAKLYFVSNLIKVDSVKFLGQWSVETHGDVYDGVIFHATASDGNYVQVSSDEPGYNHLKSLFLTQYRSAIDELNEDN